MRTLHQAAAYARSQIEGMKGGRELFGPSDPLRLLFSASFSFLLQTMQATYVLANIRSCGAETLRPTLHCVICGVSIEMMHTIISPMLGEGNGREGYHACVSCNAAATVLAHSKGLFFVITEPYF